MTDLILHWPILSFIIINLITSIIWAVKLEGKVNRNDDVLKKDIEQGKSDVNQLGQKLDKEISRLSERMYVHRDELTKKIDEMSAQITSIALILAKIEVKLNKEE